MALPLEKPPTFDAEAYLAWEESQAEKHEYINGEVFAMVGVRQSHGTATLNFAFALRRELKGAIHISEFLLPNSDFPPCPLCSPC